jgi:surface protein
MSNYLLDFDECKKSNYKFKDKDSNNYNKSINLIKFENYPYINFPIPPESFTFRFTIDTRKNSSFSPSFTEFKLPLLDPSLYGSQYNFTIDWGDGSPKQTITTWNQEETKHDYSLTTGQGEYNIVIEGICHGWSFDPTGTFNPGDAIKMINIFEWGKGFRFGNTGYNFINCENLDINANDVPDLTGITNFDNMFRACASLNSSNLSKWDVKNVTNMRFMFALAQSFNQPLNDWKVDNVTNMDRMFYLCREFDQPLDNWNTTNVNNMDRMFALCYEFNQPLNSWNVGNVTNMYAMFYSCYKFDQPLNDWDTKEVTNMNQMFYECELFDQPLNNWNTSKVTDMFGMFERCYKFNQNINTNNGNWDTKEVTDMGRMFYNCELFDQPLNNWNTSKVTNMNLMFSNCLVFNQSLNSWNVEKVTNMGFMFSGATAFKQDISDWNPYECTTYEGMFLNVNMNTINPDSSQNTTNYDNLLTKWSNKTPNLKKGTALSRLRFSAGSAQYSVGAPATARALLLSATPTGYYWDIQDGNQKP